LKKEKEANLRSIGRRRTWSSSRGSIEEGEREREGEDQDGQMDLLNSLLNICCAEQWVDMWSESAKQEHTYKKSKGECIWKTCRSKVFCYTGKKEREKKEKRGRNKEKKKCLG
jgi:hypothetical protein